jgi:predicted nucleic-acid-binding Zn-ribbon protein
MKPCPECQSNNIYRYKKYIDATGAYGPDLLPKLAPGMFSSAKILPVVCIDCGYVRFYADKESRYNLQDSKHWEHV